MSRKSKGADEYPWLADSVAAAVDEILGAMEVPAIDPAAKRALQRIYYRRNKFHGDGAGHLTLLIRSVAESETNGIAALIEPVILAINGVMRPEWTATGLRFLEAFDQIDLMSTLQTMRSLGIFSEQLIGCHLESVIWNKLIDIFAPPAAKPAERKQPASITRAPGVEKSIKLGLELLELRSRIKHNASFGHQVRRQFEVDTKTAARAMLVARVFGSKPAIYSRLSWIALVTLASPTTPPAVRASLEARILSGERIGAPEIRRARRARAARADGVRLAA